MCARMRTYRQTGRPSRRAQWAGGVRIRTGRPMQESAGEGVSKRVGALEARPGGIAKP